jgi:hypothetical protein
MTKQSVAFRNFVYAPKNEADEWTTDQKIVRLNSSRVHKRLTLDHVLMQLNLSEYLMPTSEY